MTENGAAQETLCILFQDGKTYLGAPSLVPTGVKVEGGLSLSNDGWLDPVYELSAVVQQPAPGQLQIGHACVPVLMLPSLHRLPVTGTLVPLTDLSDRDQKSLRGAYESGKKLAQDLRLGQSGLARAPASIMDRLPRPKQG
jgi:hypothetical protein